MKDHSNEQILENLIVSSSLQGSSDCTKSDGKFILPIIDNPPHFFRNFQVEIILASLSRERDMAFRLNSLTLTNSKRDTKLSPGHGRKAKMLRKPKNWW